ncbi:LOW QUALITY PROTEIN: hypothetical protein HID58_013321 [Brassica napus]|uniref:HVA22-like protein n=1 Tax=Brassica napus TaxID=3708 RepID=A0ABQ8E3L8_BRANA|nr:LOW QUALITY PROTEIN: hypothetical protein HID58_013321 [Brassica napus]
MTPLSQLADFQAKCLLEKTQVRRFHVAKRQGELVLCWHGKALVAIEPYHRLVWVKKMIQNRIVSTPSIPSTALIGSGLASEGYESTWFQHRTSYSMLFRWQVYSTFKAIENRDQNEQHKWLVYWAAYGSFSLVEVFTDKLISWFPRLASTSHRSAKQIYNNHLRPFLTRHQAGLVNEVYEQTVHCFFLQNSNTLETHNICRSRSLDHTKERFSMKLHHQANNKDKSQTLALNQNLNLNPIMKTN